jgi:hypothetical protein
MADRLPIVNVAGEGKELPASDTIAQSKINSLVSDLALKAPLAAPDFTGDVTFDTDVLVVDSVNNRVGVSGQTSPDKLWKSKVNLELLVTSRSRTLRTQRQPIWGSLETRLISKIIPPMQVHM